MQCRIESLLDGFGSGPICRRLLLGLAVGRDVPRAVAPIALPALVARAAPELLIIPHAPGLAKRPSPLQDQFPEKGDLALIQVESLLDLGPQEGVGACDLELNLPGSGVLGFRQDQSDRTLGGLLNSRPGHEHRRERILLFRAEGSVDAGTDSPIGRGGLSSPSSSRQVGAVAVFAAPAIPFIPNASGSRDAQSLEPP
jgi:hypothetical protein